MTLNRSILAEHLMERIYDVLWKNEFIQQDCEENEFKNIIRQDVLIQLGIIEEELIQSATSKAGSTNSEAKSNAARENGKLGGRPRKVNQNAASLTSNK
jgi:hypothetical protein